MSFRSRFIPVTAWPLGIPQEVRQLSFGRGCWIKFCSTTILKPWHVMKRSDFPGQLNIHTSCHLIKSIQIRTLLHYSHYGNGIDECWSRWSMDLQPRITKLSRKISSPRKTSRRPRQRRRAVNQSRDQSKGKVQNRAAHLGAGSHGKPNATCPTCKKSKAKEDFLWSCHISLSFTHVDSLVTISQSAEANPALPKARVSMHVSSNFQCYSYSNICHQLIQSWLLCFLASRGEHGHSAPKI